MYLTDEGRDKLREMPRLKEEFRRRIGDVLSDEEVTELRRMLRRLSEAMKN
jgi:DNA-binding MarR family transcriptional regulator